MKAKSVIMYPFPDLISLEYMQYFLDWMLYYIE